MGHSEGNMRLVLPRIALSGGTWGWFTAIGSDPAAILFAVAVVLLIAIVIRAGLAARARRQERQPEPEPVTAASADEGAIARWVGEGRHLLSEWQEKIERLDELQGRLAAMQAENLRLAQESEALVRERDEVRAVVARIGELVRQASEVRPRPTGEAGPDP